MFYLAFTVDGDLNAFTYWAIDDVVLTPYVPQMGSISGLVTYDNQAQSPLPNTRVYLKDANQAVVDSTITDAGGNYSFTGRTPGNYHLEATTSISWGGGNAVDGLLIMKHFVGMIQLQGLRLKAADLDANNFVNAVDGLLVMKRFVGMLFSFPLGNWSFENPEVVVTAGNNTVVNIKGICNGDVDGSRTFQP